jgi:uncharacterized protein YdiU (UPF0061 family)
MDEFNPEKVYSSIDHAGRYAYRNQPGIAHWNLAVLAQALLPVLHADQEQAVALAQVAVDAFPEQFLEAHSSGMARKLGLGAIGEADSTLAEDFLQLMADKKCDFTLAFRRLADHAGENASGEGSVGELFEFPDAFLPWLARWRKRLAEEPTSPAQRQASMYAANPVFIPRNHLVEETLQAATEQGDYEPFNTLVDVLTQPFSFNRELIRFATPPRPEQEVRQTFCGT